MGAVDAAVIAGTALMGLASVPHCAAMCGAPCASICGREPAPVLSFQIARLIGYASAGAVAAAGLGSLGAWARDLHALLGLWSLLHAAILVAGLYMIATGRMPAFAGFGARAPALATPGASQPIVWAPVRAGLAGAAWVAWPCGALQGAIVVAALASGPAGGALAMAAFALASSAGLWLAPWLWRRIADAGLQRHAVQMTGILLVVVSGWALAHGMWERVAAWCA